MTMKTKQEQIDKIQEIINDCYVVDSYIAAEGSEGGYIDAEEAAKAIVEAGYGDVSEYKVEIERLKAENEKLLDSIESVQAGRCRLRCPLTEQAVKEFAERLKKYSYTDNCFKDGKWHRYVLVSDIDELIGGKEK